MKLEYFLFFKERGRKTGRKSDMVHSYIVKTWI